MYKKQNNYLEVKWKSGADSISVKTFSRRPKKWLPSSFTSVVLESEKEAYYIY